MASAYPQLDGIDTPQPVRDAIKRSFDLIFQLQNTKQAASVITWLPLPPIQSLWTPSQVSTYGIPSYGIDGYGIVHMKGRMIPGAATADGTLLWTFPPSVRPVNSRIAVITQLGGGTLKYAALSCNADGSVGLYGASGCTAIWVDGSFVTT